MSLRNLKRKGWIRGRGLQTALYLRVVEVWQALHSEAFGQLAFDDNILHLMTQQLVIDVAGHRGLVHSKRLQGALHATLDKEKVERCPPGSQIF